jgi:putative peptidoglycan lipid II flippase
MSLATTLSRVTGFVRMWAMALALGASGLTSAYNVANNIPNMIFELVAGGILSALFIPTFMQVKAERGEEGAWKFASHVFNIFVLALGAIALLGILFPEPFIWTQTFRKAAENSDQVRHAAEFFFRFFAIQVVVYGGGMVMQGVLNAERKYLWPALGPIFNNLVVTATMLIVATMPLNRTGMTVLGVGTTLGVVAMFGVMVPALIKTKLRYVPEFGWNDPAVRRMLVLALPTLVYVITNMVAVSFRNASAIAVSPSGPSVLMYAWTFYQLPYGILAVALATAVFTEMSDAAGRDDLVAFRDTFSRGLRATAMLILPASALTVGLALPMSTLFLVGRFTASDVPLVASALRWWAAGLVFYACMMFVLRAFYSLKDTRTPMSANLVTTIVQVGGYLLLTTGVGAWAGMGINGVPLADGIFFTVQFVVLSLLLRRRVGGLEMGRFSSTFARMAVAALLAGGSAYGSSLLLAPLVPGVAGALLQLAVGGTLGLAVAFFAGRVMKVAELDVVVAMLTRYAGRLLPGKSAS